jgi:hypothetical protein
MILATLLLGMRNSHNIVVLVERWDLDDLLKFMLGRTPIEMLSRAAELARPKMVNQ